MAQCPISSPKSPPNSQNTFPAWKSKKKKTNTPDACISLGLLKNDSLRPGMLKYSASSPCSSSYHHWQGGVLSVYRSLSPHFLFLEVSEFLPVSLRNARHVSPKLPAGNTCLCSFARPHWAFTAQPNRHVIIAVLLKRRWLTALWGR